MDTKEMFERKGFDQKTIEFLNNFLYEFNDLFGSYCSQEEVLVRIKDYLDEVEFVDELPKNAKDSAIGCYDPNQKKVYVKKSDIEREKSVFFHEMVHVLREKLKEELYKESDEELPENFWLEEESPRMYLSGTGVDEGFTQYLTTKRDEKFAKERSINAYPILTEQFKFLANIIGEDELISGIFNSHEQVEIALQKKLDWGVDDCREYCEAMSVIVQYEKEILREKIAIDRKSGVDRMLEGFFSLQTRNKSKIPIRVDSAKDDIIKKYLMQTVNSVEDFYSLMENMTKYAKSLRKDVVGEMAMSLYQHYKKHPEFNLEESNPELCKSFKIYDKLQDFYNLSFEQKIQYLAEDNELQKLIHNEENSFAFKKMVVQHIYGDEFEGFRLDRFVRDDHQLSDYNALYGMLTTGVLKEKIQSGEVNPETLALEWIESDDYSGDFSTFNLFNVDVKKEKYMGTYLLGGLECSELTQYEIAKLTMEERKEQVSIICQDIYDRDVTDEDLRKYLFLRDKNSNKIILACSDENQWMNVEDGVLEISDKPEYISSITEEKTKQIKRYIDMGLPDVILINHLSMAGIIDQSVIDDYRKKTEKQYLSPNDIEVEVDRQNVSIRDIKEKVQEIAERLDKKKEGKTLLINGGEEIDK